MSQFTLSADDLDAPGLYEIKVLGVTSKALDTSVRVSAPDEAVTIVDVSSELRHRSADEEEKSERQVELENQIEEKTEQIKCVSESKVLIRDEKKWLEDYANALIGGASKERDPVPLAQAGDALNFVKERKTKCLAELRQLSKDEKKLLGESKELHDELRKEVSFFLVILYIYIYNA